MKDNLEEFNYETTTSCDSCGKRAKGTMLHAHDAMGLATPVLFLCDRCYKPTWYQRIADECKRIPKRWKILAKYYLRTSRAPVSYTHLTLPTSDLV